MSSLIASPWKSEDLVRKSFTVEKVILEDLSWGKNKLTVRAQNLKNKPQKLLVVVNTCYPHSERYWPVQGPSSFTFNGKEKKDVDLDFYVMPDHGLVEARIFIYSETEMSLRDELFRAKYCTRFLCPNRKVHEIGDLLAKWMKIESPPLPSFNFITSEHFVFYFFPETLDNAQIEKALDEWEDAYKQIRDEIGVDVNMKIIVFLLPNNKSSLAIFGQKDGPLIYGNTIVRNRESVTEVKSDLGKLFQLRFSPLLVSKAYDFHSMTGGWGSNEVEWHELRKKVVLSLFEGFSHTDIARELDIPIDQVKKAIQDLKKASLVKEQGGKDCPNFLIVKEDETKPIVSDAKATGTKIGKIIEEQWCTIENLYKELSFSDIFSLGETAFHLIGSLLLEVGMINVFFKDRSVLLPYPRRPSTLQGNDEGSRFRYYFWMVEGSRELQLKYGQRVRDIVKPQICTFGEYHFNVSRNYFDSSIEKVIKELGGKQKFSTDFLLDYIEWLRDPCHKSKIPMVNRILEDFPWRMPVYNEKDIQIVKTLIDKISPYILNHFKRDKARLNGIFETLKGSKYSEFSEFFYMYYHLVFGEAIDFLARHGWLQIPETKYDYWIQEDRILSIDELPER